MGFVLDGYSLSDEVVLEDLILSIYSNGDSVYIFSQQTKNTWLSANTEEQKAEIMQTMYGTAEFYQYGEINSIVWQYQGYIFKIEGEISQEELLLLLESLKIYEEGTEEN